jgi:hypothetical protein
MGTCLCGPVKALPLWPWKGDECSRLVGCMTVISIRARVMKTDMPPAVATKPAREESMVG